MEDDDSSVLPMLSGLGMATLVVVGATHLLQSSWGQDRWHSYLSLGPSGAPFVLIPLAVGGACLVCWAVVGVTTRFAERVRPPPSRKSQQPRQED